MSLITTVNLSFELRLPILVFIPFLNTDWKMLCLPQNIIPASCSPSMSYLWRQGAGRFLNEPTTTNNQITFTLEWLADALNSVNYYCRNCMKTNFPQLIEREGTTTIYIYFKVGKMREVSRLYNWSIEREKIVSECLRRNKGFTVKPYCSMQMDLYKNNLAAEAASTLCAFKNLFKSSQSSPSKYQYFPFHITSDFSPLSCCWRSCRGWDISWHEPGQLQGTSLWESLKN